MKNLQLIKDKHDFTTTAEVLQNSNPVSPTTSVDRYQRSGYDYGNRRASYDPYIRSTVTKDNGLSRGVPLDYAENMIRKSQEEVKPSNQIRYEQN